MLIILYKESMVDVLLIQPPIRDFYLTAKRTVPYGLASIAAAVRKAGFSVSIFDCLATSKTRKIDLPEEMAYLKPFYGRKDLSPFALFHGYKHFGYSFDHLSAAARDSGAFLVGISSLFTPYAREAIRVAEAVKHVHPSCRIVLGGHHPTALPEAVMASKAVDFVLRGEGEATLPALAQALRSGNGIESVPGLVFRRKDGSLQVGRPAVVENPGDFPMPARDLIKNSFYSRGDRISITVTASRGCPYNCAYCAVGSGSYLKYRKRPVEAVLEEISASVGEGEKGFVDFEDENLSADRAWFLTLLDKIKEQFANRDLELRAMNGLMPTTLDEKTVREMKAAGFKTLNLSLGTASAEQQRRFNRPDLRQSFEETLTWAQKYDLKAVGYIIIGAPGQKAEDSLADLVYLARQRILAGISVFYPAPGSDCWTRCIQLGILPGNKSLMRSSALPLDHETSRLEVVTLLRLCRILNYMKSLLDNGIEISEMSAPRVAFSPGFDRNRAGRYLLARFLSGGEILGITSGGRLYAHSISQKLADKFVGLLSSVVIKGYRSMQ